MCAHPLLWYWWEKIATTYVDVVYSAALFLSMFGHKFWSELHQQMTSAVMKYYCQLVWRALLSLVAVRRSSVLESTRCLR